MVHVTPIHTDHLLFSSTFLARPGQQSQAREFYLSRETGLLLNSVLTQFSAGDREIARSFFSSLHTAFKKDFPFGKLVNVSDYVKNRVIYFEEKEGHLSHLVVCQMKPHKELVILGVPDVGGDFTLPEHPFSYRSGYYDS